MATERVEIQAPPGTYVFLAGLIGEQERAYFRDSLERREVFIDITREAHCQTTGGSCMDLNVFVQKRNVQWFSDGESILLHAHISQTDGLIRLSGRILHETAFWKQFFGKDEFSFQATKPRIEDLLNILKERIPLKEPQASF